jgi:hypothetical protein
MTALRYCKPNDVFGWNSAPWVESQSGKLPLVSKELDTIYETLCLLSD